MVMLFYWNSMITEVKFTLPLNQRFNYFGYVYIYTFLFITDPIFWIHPYPFSTKDLIFWIFFFNKINFLFYLFYLHLIQIQYLFLYHNILVWSLILLRIYLENFYLVLLLNLFLRKKWLPPKKYSISINESPFFKKNYTYYNIFFRLFPKI